MEFVLVRLEIACEKTLVWRCKIESNVRVARTQLCKLLVAVVKTACEGFGCGVHDLVCSYISSLSKSLATEVAAVGAFARVSTLMCFEVSKLGKPLPTTWLFADKGLHARMGPSVDFEVCLLVKRFVAVRHRTLVPFPRLGSGGRR